MRVVVTGGGGFIGSHVAAALAEKGHDVRVLDISFPVTRGEWWSKASQILHCDLRSVTPLQAVTGADMVFHFAADMGGVEYFHSPADAPAAQANLRIDLNVIKACRDSRVPFFYASSACLYPASSVPLHEGLIGQGPADRLYGEEKRFVTLLLEAEPLARVGVFHTIYGPGQEWQGPRAKFPGAICRKVKSATATSVRNPEVSAPGAPVIEIWGDGSQTRTFLYIDDAVEKILTVATAADYGGPVNIGSDEEVTVRQCADWLCAHAGVEPRYRFRSDKPVGTLVRGCDNTEYDRRYGRPGQVPARDGLVRMFEWVP